MFANTTGQMIVAVAITGLLVGGFITSSTSVVALSFPLAQQGVIYGLAQSASALGKGVGPILGGAMAPLIGLKPVFLVAAAAFILSGILNYKLLPKSPDETKEKTTD